MQLQSWLMLDNHFHIVTMYSIIISSFTNIHFNVSLRGINFLEHICGFLKENSCLGRSVFWNQSNLQMLITGNFDW